MHCGQNAVGVDGIGDGVGLDAVGVVDVEREVLGVCCWEDGVVKDGIVKGVGKVVDGVRENGVGWMVLGRMVFGCMVMRRILLGGCLGWMVLGRMVLGSVWVDDVGECGVGQVVLGRWCWWM